MVVVGGGFGGATAARYLRQLAPEVKVTLVEPATRFYTCPFSNLYLGGLRTFESIGHGYDGLRADGVEVVHARAEDVDATARTVRLSNGRTLKWDRLVLSPGIDSAGMRCRVMTRRLRGLPRTPGRQASRRNCCTGSCGPCPMAAPS